MTTALSAVYRDILAAETGGGGGGGGGGGEGEGEEGGGGRGRVIGLVC